MVGQMAEANVTSRRELLAEPPSRPWHAFAHLSSMEHLVEGLMSFSREQAGPFKPLGHRRCITATQRDLPFAPV